MPLRPGDLFYDLYLFVRAQVRNHLLAFMERYIYGHEQCAKSSRPQSATSIALNIMAREM